MKPYVAAIDAGTGGVRCVLFDAGGKMISRDYRELTTLYTRDGHAEQDPIQLIRGAWDAIRGAIVRSGIDASEIVGVSVTGTQTTFATVDAGGNFLSNIILWQDGRGSAMFPWIRARLAERGMTEDMLYDRTLRPLDGMLAGAKLLWLRENEPEVYARTAVLANPQSILLRALGAEAYTIDSTDGGWFLFENTATLEPDPVLLDMFELNPRLFPTQTHPGARVGSVSRQAASQTGLRSGTPLFQGAVDQCCAALGAGNDGREEVCTLCMGTAGIVLSWSGQPRPDPMRRCYVIHWPTGGFASEYAVPVAASAFRWVRDMLYPSAAFGREELYSRMDAEASCAPLGSDGLAFLPFLAGSVYPKLDENLRGGWLGASLGTSRPALVRSALEGICYEMRQVLEAGNRRYDTIRLLGGAARSELWCRMQADVCNCSVETMACDEASALGAAMIAAAGAGLYGSIGEATRGMSQIKRRYEPNPDNTGSYEECYAAWLACTEALSDRVFPALMKLRT